MKYLIFGGNGWIGSMMIKLLEQEQIKYNISELRLDNTEEIYKKYLKDNHYDLNKIKILTAIIFLNMSPLHEYPFDKFLFAYGIKLLDKHTK